MRLQDRMKSRASLMAVAIGLGLWATGGAATAQEAEPTVNVLDEIVVTAQRREQNLQDVPIVVTALGEQLLEDAGVRDIKDLQILTPGLTVTSTSNETITTARVRGVGTVGDNAGLESSVLVTIDGVYRPRNGVGFGDLGVLERIEVLKGPQGTLFGKNASAGVINIFTEAPRFNFGVEAEVTAGNYGQVGGSILVTGPLIADTLAGSLYFADRQRDGFLDVVTGPGPRTLTEDVDQNFYTVRGQLLWQPADRLSGRFIADYTSRDENCCLGVQLFVGGAANSRAALINAVRPGSIDTTATPFDRIASANSDTGQTIEDQGVSAEFNFDVTPDMTLTSITAARKWRSENGQDSDFTAADIAYRPSDGSNFNEIKQFSQELRLTGTDGPVDWLFGAFYAKEDLTSGSVLLYGADYYPYFANGVLGGVPGLLGMTAARIYQPGNGQRDSYDQSGETFAIFADTTVNMTDRLAFNLGLRWTRDDKTLTSVYSTTGASCDQAEATYRTLAGLVGAATAGTIVGGLCVNHENDDFDALGPVTQDRSEEATTGTLKLKYDFSDNAMTYASYSRGFKSGGYNLDREQAIVITPTGPNFTADPNTDFAGEYVDSFEIGSKLRLLSGALTLNAAAFHQTYTDFQLNTFVGTAFVVETLPEVISKGVDADFAYATPIDGLSLQGGLTYAETTISDFTAADLIDPNRFPQLSRLPGAQLSFAPKTSASLAVSYERRAGGGLLLRGNVSAKYMSEFNTGSDLHPAKAQDAYTLVNARIGLGAESGAWTLEAWAQNLFDEDYLQVGFNGPFQVDEFNDSVSVYNAFLGQPRTYGLTLRLSY
ncbi:MAG: TonB-dependent receptor [Alphaproteobacteria bacterium]|uniref:Colicin I receptor n=1 Tax=Brevundimonas mediterranea TaxID=74329 RepID=A0A7Z8Y4I2_9CAUL|nr:TonB-dependent receptor [Brevundimonas mediterranea]MBU2031225.1 TonB-dependent receptor [Alphaproteobacteria bacterium]TAJ43286.1 MAG: TonB-dependent receptor [Brevundimonas sp.]MBU2163104.1 TonB-dependent receptor [Alphaproteobacteria bacterium]MBU2231753.1 TonB-dependent receptor [Alphaproteobacteria bacterium]VDC50530.1 Colicin I receptor [Brevundimonas mediterranea]